MALLTKSDGTKLTIVDPYRYIMDRRSKIERIVVKASPVYAYQWEIASVFNDGTTIQVEESYAKDVIAFLKQTKFKGVKIWLLVKIMVYYPGIYTIVRDVYGRLKLHKLEELPK